MIGTTRGTTAPTTIESRHRIATQERNTPMVAQRSDAPVGMTDVPVVVSVVAPVYNEEETLPHFYRRLTAVLEELGEPFELVLVNDGSTDNSYRAMRELHARDPRVRV